MTNHVLVETRHHYQNIPRYQDSREDFDRRQWVTCMSNARMWRLLGDTEHTAYWLDSAAYYRRGLTATR